MSDSEVRQGSAQRRQVGRLLQELTPHSRLLVPPGDWWRERVGNSSANRPTLTSQLIRREGRGLCRFLRCSSQIHISIDGLCGRHDAFLTDANVYSHLSRRAITVIARLNVS